MLLFGRRKLATAGLQSNQQNINQVRLRIVQQVFNSRKLVYRNRVATNRCALVVSAIESAHEREQATRRVNEQNILADLKRKKSLNNTTIPLRQYYEPIDLTEPRDFYRFGVRVHSASPKLRSRLPGVHSGFARPVGDGARNRVKSASTLSRPYTAPIQMFHGEHSDPDDGESDDEAISISISRMTSGKRSVESRSAIVSSSVLSHHPAESTTTDDTMTSIIPSASHRITWPVKLRVFALQDENEARKQFLAWRAEQRKGKMRRSSKTFFDVELERQYQQSIRRRQEIEAFVTPELVDDAKSNDPIFAKRFRQLKLAVKAGKVPAYDPTDREINVTMTKSKIERARTALITAKQSKIKTLYHAQQTKNDAILTKRIKTFLERVKKLKDEDEQREGHV